MLKKIDQDYLRSALFGFEDGLVSTTGVVVGISTGTTNAKFIVLAGLVTIAVEALSMGAGEFLSEQAVHELDHEHRHHDNIIFGALLMFIAYIVAGMIPLLPILLFMPPVSTWAAVIAALLGLLLLGYVKGVLIGVSPGRSALQILIVGGLAMLAGLVMGQLFHI